MHRTRAPASRTTPAKRTSAASVATEPTPRIEQTNQRRRIASPERLQQQQQQQQQQQKRIASSAAAALPSAGPAAAPAPALAPAPAIPTAAHQALMRFMHVNGRATRSQVESVFDEIKQHCSSMDSKTLPLQTALDHLNLYLRFMELEIRRLKSEVDQQEYWILVDNTERVRNANAEHFQLQHDQQHEQDEEKEEKSNGGRKNSNKAAAAAASSSSSSSATAAAKPIDSITLAKVMNPSIFTEKQIAYFETFVSRVRDIFVAVIGVEAILRSPSGQISQSAAIRLRSSMMQDKKHAFTNDTDCRQCIVALISHGWVRENVNEEATATATGAGNKRRAKRKSNLKSIDDDGATPLCLGERSYAELRSFIEERTEGRKCSTCQQTCLLVSQIEKCIPCLSASTDSYAASVTAASVASHRICDVRLHYHCAEQTFLRRGRINCPECACEWDIYLQKHQSPSAAGAAAVEHKSETEEEE